MHLTNEDIYVFIFRDENGFFGQSPEPRSDFPGSCTSIFIYLSINSSIYLLIYIYLRTYRIRPEDAANAACVTESKDVTYELVDVP